jgi:hypothetical protein
MADIIILAVLAVLIVLAVRYILIHNFGLFTKNKDQKPSCGSSCAGCSGCGLNK